MHNLLIVYSSTLCTINFTAAPKYITIDFPFPIQERSQNYYREGPKHKTFFFGIFYSDLINRTMDPKLL